jgi:lipopolysaccharide biosynthesis glycosyltransferase
MRILLTFDTGYAPHAATVMESIIQNCPEKLDFVVIYYDLNKEMQDILSKHFLNKVKSLEFVKLNDEIFTSIEIIKAPKRFQNFNIYLRIFTPQLLTDDEHVIYLDCDIIVQDNILNILNDADLSMPLCAVTEYNPAYKFRDLTIFKAIEKPRINPWIVEAFWYRTYCDLELNHSASYFNSGVMIINLAYWRKNKVTKKTLNFLLAYPERIYNPDQDALNHVLNGNYYALDPKWNSACGSLLANYSAEKLTAAIAHPSIIHVGTALKTWCYACYNTQGQNLYWRYRRFTPWKKKEYKDKTLKNILLKQKRHIVKIIKFIIGKKISRFLRLILIGDKKEMVFSKIRVK